MSRTPYVSSDFEGPYGRRSSAIAPPPGDDVGSAGIEAALADLDRALCRDRCHAVVSAPVGPGKTFLLRAFAERLAGSFRVVHVHPATVRDDDICAQILGALGEDPERDAELRLLSVLQEIGSQGSALVLLIDDASSLPAATLRRLGRLAAIARPDLRLVLVVTSERRSGGDAIPRVVAALGVGAEKVVLESRPERSEPAPVSRAPLETAARRESIEGWARKEVLDAIHLEPRRIRPRPARGRQAATVLLGTALALLALHRLSVPGMGPLALEPSRIVEREEPNRPALSMAGVGLQSAIVASVHPTPESDPAVPSSAKAVAGEEPAPAGRRPRPEVASAASDAAETSPESTGPVAETPVETPKPASVARAPAIPVSVNAQPWARIEVDGREVGVTPLADLPMAPGLHEFRAYLPDGRVVERKTEVDAYRDRVVFP